MAPHLIRYGEAENANFFKQAQELAKVRLFFYIIQLSIQLQSFLECENSVGQCTIRCQTKRAVRLLYDRFYQQSFAYNGQMRAGRIEAEAVKVLSIVSKKT